MLDTIFAAGQGLLAFGDPYVLLMMFLGVALGIVVGILPGLGGIIGLTLVLPFTFDMDPMAALVLMVALSSAVSMSDTIPAVLFGVPGTVGCAATVMDGYPMARRGEASRVLGAAFMASCVGGVIGGLVLLFFIPILRPVILQIGSPEMLALCIFGLSLAAALAGKRPLKGLTAACIGLILATVGLDPQLASGRWIFDTLYLQDGLSIAVVGLGFFALPELADLAISRQSLVDRDNHNKSSQKQGFVDVLRHWWLVTRCSGLGAMLGAVPGIGASVIDWLAYGHALKTEKGAAETFGKGDIRGVLASEASNNARHGGSLIPTIAFGVPGSPAMAILLAAFLIFGIVPGPEMLSRHLDITMSMVWTVILAHIVGTIICCLFAKQLSRIALIRPSLLVPLVMATVYIGSLQETYRWGDLVLLIVAGVFGWIMKRFGWPRPPLILGFVLGSMIERYMFISVGRWGWEWLTNWLVLVLLLMSAWVFFGSALRALLGGRNGKLAPAFAIDLKGALKTPTFWFGLMIAVFFAYTLITARMMPWQAALVPTVISIFGLAGALLSLGTELRPANRGAQPDDVTGFVDLQSDYGDLSNTQIWFRAIEFMAWTLGFLVLALCVGVVFALGIHLFLYLYFGWKEKLSTSLIAGTVVAVCTWIIFEKIVYTPWPQAYIGDLFPYLRNTYRLF